MTNQEDTIKSTFIIEFDNQSIELNTHTEAVRKFRSIVSKDGGNLIAYLYRKDFKKNNKVETFMIG